MSPVPESDPVERGGFGDVPMLRGEVAFRLLVESVADYAIFLLGPDGRVLTWNLGAQRIKGYTADEIIGQHFSRFYTPEEREQNRPQRVLGWAAEYGRFEDEGWRVRKDGTRFWADVVITALLDENGQPYGYAKVTRDMTERRAAEQQRIALAAEQQARGAAEEALRARDRFLSIAAHELKTPVASLQLTTESIVRAKAAGRLDEARLDTGLRRLTRAATQLGLLVNELLDVSRLTTEAVPLHTAPTDVADLTREVVARFDGAGLDRITVNAPAEAWIPADAARLEQVVSNLVDNALKYSAPPARIVVEVTKDDDGLTLSVADEGIGLDGVDEERIFEAFGRGHNAEHFQGMGLGLFISQQIVARHGGRIDAASRGSGPGSVFTVWLPAGGQPVPDEPE